MTLTVTGTPVSRVGRLMCTDSTLTTITRALGFSRTRPTISRTSRLFPAGLAPWAHLTCPKSLNVVWAVLHEMLRFRAIFLNESSNLQYVADDSPSKVLVQQTS